MKPILYSLSCLAGSMPVASRAKQMPGHELYMLAYTPNVHAPDCICKAQGQNDEDAIAANNLQFREYGVCGDCEDHEVGGAAYGPLEKLPTAIVSPDLYQALAVSEVILSHYMRVLFILLVKSVIKDQIILPLKA